MVRKVIYAGFLVILGALAMQIYKIGERRHSAMSEIANISEEFELINADNLKLNEQINYFSDPRNLEKELRSRFNYRLPSEKLIIVVPEQEN